MFRRIPGVLRDLTTWKRTQFWKRTQLRLERRRRGGAEAWRVRRPLSNEQQQRAEARERMWRQWMHIRGAKEASTSHPGPPFLQGNTVHASGTAVSGSSLTNLTLRTIVTTHCRFYLQFCSKYGTSFARQGFMFHITESGSVIGDATLFGAIVRAGASGRSIFFSERGRGHDVSVLGRWEQAHRRCVPVGCPHHGWSSRFVARPCHACGGVRCVLATGSGGEWNFRRKTND
jgi:hypothetical protein